LPRIESDRTSITAASVLVGKIDSSLNLSHRVFDEAHGPLAMAAFVWRRRLQGLERRAKRAQSALHIALISFRWQCGERERWGGDARGRGDPNHISAGRRKVHGFKSFLIGRPKSVVGKSC
jgi:hypothetical protein